MTTRLINKKAKGAFYFMAMAALTAIACVFIIKEGRRIKMENELLAYEVW
ncbi:MAG: hypothetical protein M3Z92_10750 [Bacteroidota bacterium]|nr:hypothetical protein [Bacteroidota bacterium]MDQ6890401.1 hypothetical protein [Bacteroidota bacterium]